jgi:hypothetical protein
VVAAEIAITQLVRQYEVVRLHEIPQSEGGRLVNFPVPLSLNLKTGAHEESPDVWHNHKGGYYKIATFLVSAALVWYCAFASGFAQAQAPGCQCTFKEAPWEAHGTKAACTAITRKGGTSCEIEFGGVSTDPKIAAQVLGLDRSAYTRDAYKILGQYLQYLMDNKREAMADPKFLSVALPIFMRGAYLRRSLGEADYKQVRSLDSDIINFLDKNSDQVSKVFLGYAQEFSVTIEDANFTVGKGYITVKHPFGFLITRYMPAE